MKDTWAVDADQPDGPVILTTKDVQPYIDEIVDDWMSSPINSGETLEIKITYAEVEVAS